jgi:predicted DNA-binding transcriptional regulator AlpA
MIARRNDLKTIPAALRRADAALHCGISTTYFDELVRQRVLPQPRQLGVGIKIWLRAELESALLTLPEAGEPSLASHDVIPNPCDRLLP